MKKLLSLISALNFAVISTTSVAACSWTTPPLSVATISDILQVAKQQVVDAGLEQGSIKTIFGGKDEMSWPDLSGEIDGTTIKLWSDPITGSVASALANVSSPEGLINQSKNIITGADVEQWSKDEIVVPLEQLKLLQSYNISVTIADIAKTDKDYLSLGWFSSGVSEDSINNSIKKKQVKNQEQHTQDDCKVSENEYYQFINFEKTEKELWKAISEPSDTDSGNTYFRIRFLITFTPNTSDPVWFYLDKKFIQYNE